MPILPLLKDEHSHTIIQLSEAQFFNIDTSPIQTLVYYPVRHFSNRHTSPISTFL